MSITRFPTPMTGGLSNSLAAGIVGNNSLDPFHVADNNNIIGQLLGDLIGSAFNDHRGLQTMTAVAASTTAMDAVVASSTAMTAVIASSTAMTAVIASSTAMTAVAASTTAMNAVVASTTAMNAVVASTTAVQAIRNSSVANNIALGSSFSVGAYLDRVRIIGGAGTDTTLAGLQTMTAVAASTTAMDAVVASGTALRAICMSTSASSVTSALQSRRTTVITTLNAAATQFTRQINLTLHVNSSVSEGEVDRGFSSIIIPISFSSVNSVLYTFFSLSNDTQIHQVNGNGSTMSISTGVAIRGLRSLRNIVSSGVSITYDRYTAII